LGSAVLTGEVNNIGAASIRSAAFADSANLI
jgi:hypothetical protein